MGKTAWVSFCLALLLAASGSDGATLAAPSNLRCEYRVNPLGIDSVQPRLSWNLTQEGRGLMQSAYQILAAGSEAALAGGTGDLWDSGKVASGDAIQIRYAGKPLAAHQACWWKVRIWNQDGQESPWSEPALFTVGPMAAADWADAKWIGFDGGETETAASEAFKKGQWIWYPEANPASNAAPGIRYFRKTVELPAGVVRGVGLVGVDNEMTLFVNGENAGTWGTFLSATELAFTERLKPGKNVLAISANNMGDGPNPAGVFAVFTFEMADGTSLFVPADETWRASDAEVNGWQQPGFDDSGWKAAKVLGDAKTKPWDKMERQATRVLAARMLRKEVAVEQPVKSAMAYLCGLGLSELYINGAKIGDDVLSPALTEYNKRAVYVTHDVTAALRQGANAVGVMLGNGRYYAPRTNEPTNTLTYGYPKMLFLLRVELADGSVQTLVSDASWKLTTEGPIRANNEYDGEVYDARLEMPGWAAPGFDDAKWQAAQVVDAPGAAVSAQMMEPIRIIETLHPIGMTNPKPGMYIYDMGQNMVGWCRLAVSGPKGARVRLRFAETVRDDGTLYLDNIRGAKVTDDYYLKGEGAEVYEPRFTYHGFRYVEMTGYPGQPELAAIEGCVVHDAVEPSGSFRCSNELVNKISENIRWGVRGNYRSISTDCPQRDERQGWLGDRSAECRGETYLFHIPALYAKWVCDMHDAQKDSGSVSDVCPSYWPLYNDNVTWPSSFIIIPGMLYEQYGDTRVIEARYDGMKKWIAHMSTYLKNDIMPKDNYGDWCVPPEEQHLIHSKDPARKTPGEFLGTSYFYYDCTLMARYATLLGKDADAAEFTALAERLKKAFNEKYLDEKEAKYANGAATTCVLPLAFGLAPDNVREGLFKRLADKIAIENNGHTSTGLIGGQYLMRALSDNGRADIAWTLASQSTYPSWGYMVGKGATTIWELWNGDTADPAMNSHNHVMLVGDLNIWLYEYLGGIKPAAPGFKRIALRPYLVDGLDFVEVSHKCPYGQIFSQWRKKDGKAQWRVSVPANTSAQILIPAKDAGAITESGKPAAQAEGLKAVTADGGLAGFEAAPGQYDFEWPLN